MRTPLIKYINYKNKCTCLTPSRCPTYGYIYVCVNVKECAYAYACIPVMYYYIVIYRAQRVNP